MQSIEYLSRLCLFLGACFPAGILALVCYKTSVFIPTIARHYDYVPASLTVQQIDLLPRHCCRLDCFCHEVNDAKAESCSAMQNRSKALSPLLCPAFPSANASSLCPPTGSAAICNNGPFCCTSCNQTCPITQSESVCKCPCSGCSTCSNCCKHVEGRLCRLFCDPCFVVNMTVAFNDRHGMPRVAIISYNAGSHQADAERYYSAHVANSTFLGFYKPSDPTIVHTSRGYQGQGWFVFSLCLLPIFLVATLITCYLTGGVLKVLKGDVSGKVMCWVNWVLWVGIIWPFVILLLILELSYPTPPAKTALRIVIPLLACIGWAPPLLLYLRRR